MRSSPEDFVDSYKFFLRPSPPGESTGRRRVVENSVEAVEPCNHGTLRRNAPLISTQKFL